MFYLTVYAAPLILLLINMGVIGHEIIAIAQFGVNYWCEWMRVSWLTVTFSHWYFQSAPLITFTVFNVLYVLGIIIKQYELLQPLIYLYKSVSNTALTFGIAFQKIFTFVSFYTHLYPQEEREIVGLNGTYAPVNEHGTALRNIGFSFAMFLLSAWTYVSACIFSRVQAYLEEKKEQDEKRSQMMLCNLRRENSRTPENLTITSTITQIVGPEEQENTESRLSLSLRGIREEWLSPCLKGVDNDDMRRLKFFYKPFLALLFFAISLAVFVYETIAIAQNGYTYWFDWKRVGISSFHN